MKKIISIFIITLLSSVSLAAQSNDTKKADKHFNKYEFIEAEILETSELISKSLKDSNLPKEIRIGAILRDDKVVIPRSNFVFQKDDRVVFLAKKDSISVVENIFRISSI